MLNNQLNEYEVKNKKWKVPLNPCTPFSSSDRDKQIAFFIAKVRRKYLAMLSVVCVFLCKLNSTQNGIISK